MKKTSLLLFLILIVIFSCKKENNIIPVVAPQTMNDSLFKTKASFSFLSLAGNINSGIPYYYFPSTVKVNASTSKLAESYKWYLVRSAGSDSLLSTEKNPSFAFSSILTNVSIKLITQNNISIDSISKQFDLRSAPSGMKITSIVIDSMSFINPSTMLSWNGVGGADVFCQIFSGTTTVMDTINGTGWSSAPGTVSGVYPVKVNLTTIPYTIKYPNSIRTFTISSAIAGVTMLDTFKVKIFNKNSSGPVDLIGEADLIPSAYFGGTLPTTIYVKDVTNNLYLKLTVSWI